MKKLAARLKAGRVKRYHTAGITGEQTVGEHTYGVCQILQYLYDPEYPPNYLKISN